MFKGVSGPPQWLSEEGEVLASPGKWGTGQEAKRSPRGLLLGRVRKLALGRRSVRSSTSVLGSQPSCQCYTSRSHRTLEDTKDRPELLHSSSCGAPGGRWPRPRPHRDPLAAAGGNRTLRVGSTHRVPAPSEDRRHVMTPALNAVAGQEATPCSLGGRRPCSSRVMPVVTANKVRRVYFVL